MHKIESAKNMQSPLELCFVKFNITDVCSTLFNIYIHLQRYLRIIIFYVIKMNKFKRFVEIWVSYTALK